MVLSLTFEKGNGYLHCFFYFSLLQKHLYYDIIYSFSFFFLRFPHFKPRNCGAIFLLMNNRDRLYLAFFIFLVAYFFNNPLVMHPQSQAEPTATRTAKPTFTPTPQPTSTIDTFQTEMAIEVELIESYNAPTDTPQPTITPVLSLNTPTPRLTPTSPPCQLNVPGSSSYGVGGCLRVNLFETVGYKSAALSLGEHRTNGDLTNSNIKCLALRVGGDVLAIANDTDLWQINADNSASSEAIQLGNIGYCLWSPDGLFLAIEANNTIYFVPYHNDWYKYKNKAWPVWLAETENKTLLIGWAIVDNLPLLLLDNGAFWLCHPIQGCRFVHEEQLTIYGVNQYGLPHSEGFLWTAE